jgi:hypothetical protein
LTEFHARATGQNCGQNDPRQQRSRRAQIRQLHADIERSVTGCPLLNSNLRASAAAVGCGPELV